MLLYQTSWGTVVWYIYVAIYMSQQEKHLTFQSVLKMEFTQKNHN